MMKSGAVNFPIGPSTSESESESYASAFDGDGCEPPGAPSAVKDTDVTRPVANPSNHATSLRRWSKKRTFPSAPPVTRYV